ncbi:AMIN domain-containing protein, partial [Agrobacterium sp. a22-2]|uniref:AMIN domain-containing protein n=1 Tax=Agrobacterium sp. a22-2 TaxID=2283840 RepID=UPI0034CE7834
MSGIANVTVTNSGANTIRVTVNGENAPPQIELFDGDEGLIFGVVPTANTAQTPPTTPTEPNTETEEAQTPPIEPESEEAQTPSAEPNTETEEAQTPLSEPEEIPEILVTGRQDDGYN